MSSLLEIKKLSVSYRLIEVLSDVSLEILPGQIVSLVGANGAGKSTLMKSILGMLRPKSGDIFFKSKSISGLKSHQIIRLGVSQSPEGRQVFAHMTVHENLLMGAYPQKLNRNDLNGRLDEILTLFPVLRSKTRARAVTLSGGEQQMLAIGRALMPKPSLLLLDEPTLGISPILTEKIFDILISLSQKGTALLMTEQNAALALEISNHGYVLENGKIVYEGKPSELLQNDVVRKAYLGI